MIDQKWIVKHPFRETKCRKVEVRTTHFTGVNLNRLVSLVALF